ncbi:MAG: antitoxin, partial [Pseudomonadota bacterium]
MAKKATQTGSNPDDAMSAVEAALKIDFGEEATADSVLDDKSGIAAKNQNSGKAPARSSVVSPKASPANDDRRGNAARLAAALARKPSSAPIWVAIILSLIWTATALWAGSNLLGPTVFQVSSWLNLSETPDLVYLAASIIIPVLLIFAYAFMVRRSQELKIAATNMTEAAYRLIEPETDALDGVRSVGQAVQQEVGAMSEGIDRAISRAGELSTMI